MYLMSKMLVGLALSGLIGLLIGWAIGKLGYHRHTRRIEEGWQQTLADTEEDHARVVTRFKKSNQALDDENNNLRTKIAALNNKIDEGREDVEKGKSLQEQLNTRIQSSESRSQSMQAELNEEKAKNHKLQNLTKALKASSDEKDRTNQQLATALEDTKTQLQSLNSLEDNENYMSLQREVGELRAAQRENADLRQRLAIEGREREEAQSELQGLRQKVDTVEQEKDSLRQWAQRLEQEQAGFDDRVKQSVNTALRNEGSNANELEIEVSRLKPMVANLRSEVEQLTLENNQLKTQAQRGTTASTDSSAQVRELQSALNEIGYERDQLKTRLADQERQTAALNTRLSGALNPPDIAQLRRQVAELSAEKGLMAATIDELQNKLGV
jgi:chromosome segregation ATPase